MRRSWEKRKHNATQPRRLRRFLRPGAVTMQQKENTTSRMHGKVEWLFYFGLVFLFPCWGGNMHSHAPSAESTTLGAKEPPASHENR